MTFLCSKLSEFLQSLFPSHTLTLNCAIQYANSKYKDDRTKYKDNRTKYKDNRTKYKDYRTKYKDAKTKYKDDRTNTVPSPNF